MNKINGTVVTLFLEFGFFSAFSIASLSCQNYIKEAASIKRRSRRTWKMIKFLSTFKKSTVAVVLILLMVSTVLAMQSPANAQQTSAQNPRLQGSIPLPSGVTANITVNTLIFLSFR